jgi:hypothetical protein
MKAIICFRSGDIHIHSFTEQWTACACGNVKVKWLDAKAGTVVVAAQDRESVRLLGMNNGYLIPAIKYGGMWEDYRKMHDEATNASGYLFDKSMASCWAVVVKIGRSNDVRWATDEEYLQAFPT